MALADDLTLRRLWSLAKDTPPTQGENDHFEAVGLVLLQRFAAAVLLDGGG